MHITRTYEHEFAIGHGDFGWGQRVNIWLKGRMVGDEDNWDV